MILFYDTETTGIPRWDLPADHESQPRIVDLGAVLCGENGEELDRYESIVRPDGWTVHDGAAKVHGITTEIAAKDGAPIQTVLAGFDQLSRQATLMVCFNLRFDEKLLRGERRRLGQPDGFGQTPVFCCMKAATPLCKIPPTKKMKSVGFDHFKTPKLSEAVKILLGREHDGAHRAMADAIATKELYFALRGNEAFMKAGSAFRTNEARAA